jgi:VWFA-related protein
MRSSRTFIALSMVAWLLVSAAFPSAQQPPQQPPSDLPTFRSSARLVVQTVTVTGRDGRPIEGLTPEDFIVTEDGERQEVSFVEYQQLAEWAASLPADAVPAAPAGATRAPAAASPFSQSQIAVPPGGDVSGAAYRDRRLVVLYFDLSALPETDRYRAYRAAHEYVDTQMSSSELMAIMTFQQGAVRVKQDFTDDRARLRETIDILINGEDIDGDGIPDNPDVGTAFGQDGGEFNILNTDRQLAALQTALNMLRGLPEQKSLVYFASGLRLNGVDNQAQLRATTNAAIRANVAIFPVDARGLVASAPLGDASRASQGGIGIFTGRLAEATVNRFQRSQDTLYAIARDTGGKALFDYNDLTVGIQQAAQAITSYYVVGFYSTHAALDGKFRRVRVSLAPARAGLSAELTYRDGYYADKEFSRFTTADKERQLEEALMLENPITEVTMAMEVNYFQLSSAEYFVPVSVKIPGSELALAQRGGAQRTVIDFIGVVKDDYGITIQNLRDKLDIALDAETAGQLASRPIQYETGFTLLPGRYVIKVLARDAETGRIGTYMAAFTVPNLNREATHVPISSVVLGSQRVATGDEIYNAQKNQAALQAVNPLVFDGQKLLPSVTRVFSRTRSLHVVLQAYQRNAETTEPLISFVTLYRDGAKVLETAPMAVTEGLTPRSKAVPLRFEVPLGDLPVGSYECQVTVLDGTNQKVAFWRAPVVIAP